MEIVVSTEAQQHILQISEYLQEIYGEIVANKAYEEIMERIQLLAMFPQMGVLQEDIKVGNDFEMRSVVSKPNVVYYALSQSKQKIVIIAILDSRQSPETIRKIISTILISHSLSRRFRYSPVPHHEGGEQADAPRVRQTDDLLPDIDADAGGYPGHSDYLDAIRSAGLPAFAGRRLEFRGALRVRGAAFAGRVGTGVHHRGGVYRG